ncbi:LAMI_0C03444g1_1 [Lachancea mirantina]|uniref:LAMI_0C03444g1_1 n=1 Tax=Lachancea mirantina TaxID=1230905 RepID=A0A1G4J2B3_9SACH|nr:LAMI_0C03444g1_1 [Lachancea mirantina]
MKTTSFCALTLLWSACVDCLAFQLLQKVYDVNPVDEFKGNADKRDLRIGQLNFFQTTDVHGWLGSHLTQPIYDADWGDFVSFTDIFKKSVLGSNDLILIDTGDKHDGNGISDATDPPGIESGRIFNEQDYDLMTLGNHELYTELNTELEYYGTALIDKFKDKYVSSNVEFIHENGTSVPFGNKYRYFETPQLKFKVLALSFMFDFQRTNARAKVTPATEEVNKEWFAQLLKDHPAEEIDVLVVFGHMPITDPQDREINHLHTILRKFYPNTVIQYFGGHSHIRDFAVLDSMSTGLQSGRFAETLGFLSIDDVREGEPKFFRRYIDFSKSSFAFHAKLASSSDLETSRGIALSKRIKALRESLNLTQVLGYVPENYYMYNAPSDSKNNIYNLITNKVLPRLRSNVTDDRKNRFIVINTGSIRYDLHRGLFTKDTEYIVSPFSNDWNYLEVPYALAKDVTAFLNRGPTLVKKLSPPGVNAAGLHLSTLESKVCPFISNPSLSEGYTTSDECGCKGDDSKHRSQKYFEVPSVVQSEELIPSVAADDNVHFVFYSFIEPYVLQALNSINGERKIVDHHYTSKDCKLYGGKSTKVLLQEYFGARSQIE